MTSYVREFGAEMRLRVGFGSESERPGWVALRGVIKGKAKGRGMQRRPSVIGEDGGREEDEEEGNDGGNQEDGGEEEEDGEKMEER